MAYKALSFFVSVISENLFTAFNFYLYVLEVAVIMHSPNVRLGICWELTLTLRLKNVFLVVRIIKVVTFVLREFARYNRAVMTATSFFRCPLGFAPQVRSGYCSFGVTFQWALFELGLVPG